MIQSELSFQSLQSIENVQKEKSSVMRGNSKNSLESGGTGKLLFESGPDPLPGVLLLATFREGFVFCSFLENRKRV